MLSPELEQILQQLYREARKAHYEFISLEHPDTSTHHFNTMSRSYNPSHALRRQIGRAHV